MGRAFVFVLVTDQKKKKNCTAMWQNSRCIYAKGECKGRKIL